MSSSPEPTLPEAGFEPNDPNALEYQDEDPPAAPPANPTTDMDAVEPTDKPDDSDLSDNESILSDVDEAQFEDFDPNAITIDERPAIAVDEDNVRLLGRHKRKRADGEVDGESKKKKEKRREKVKKSRKRREDDSDMDFEGGAEVEGKRRRKKQGGSSKEGRDGEALRKERAQERRRQELEDEERMDPEERRRRALDRAMDAALKNPTKRRNRAGEIDLTTALDEQITSLRIRMAEAAEADIQCRTSTPPRPASHKLKLLPEVISLLSRTQPEHLAAIVDPETNLLESVRFFLEPQPDGALPAYNIQRSLFQAIARLPIDKDSLVSSGLGKVVLFYTKSKKPEESIKRAAERLVGEWTRPLLKRSDDYRKRALQTVDYDPTASRRTLGGLHASSDHLTPEQKAQAEKDRQLAMPNRNPNRARLEQEVKTYTIAPRSRVVVGGGQFARPVGASGEDAFRRMKMRQQMGKGGAGGGGGR